MRTITAGGVSIRITVDAPTRGVAVLDVTIGSASTSAPLHWRAGDWTKPPLDISLGPHGRPEGVQVVLQDEEALPTDGVVRIEVEPGVPTFDVDEWPTDRYLDARAAVQAKRLDSGELVVSIGDGQPTRRLELGTGLQFGLDASGEMVEVVIGPLDDDQWRLVVAASP
jgi:hypothetical protein